MKLSKLHKRRVAGAMGGSGGGGGSSRAPVESPDSLLSRQYARIIDALCEGEIEGVVGGAKGIYLDGTVLQNTDGSYNFTGVSVEFRNGTPTQDYIGGFNAAESEVPVGVVIEASVGPVVRTISSSEVTHARITLSTPQFTSQNPTTGDLTGSSVAFKIDVQANGGGYVTYVNDAFSGKTTSRYQRSYVLALPGSPPWDIRVTRTTADSTTVNTVNKIYWDSYTQIIDEKLRYPNTALVAIEVDAQQFNRVPQRAYLTRGLKVQVPVNYDPSTRVYTGTWDGTFKLAWTDNPAWCFYDLVTDTRYGLGALVPPALVDKWALYDIGKYCDELVPDGFGGQEPRFRCNVYLQTREEAYNVLLSMASIFRGMIFWSSGSITAVQDAPADPIALFTQSNVLGGAFSYQGTARNVRHTVALVAWNDPDDMYRPRVEYVEDVEGIARYGVIETEVVALGATSRGQAHRLGRSILYSERLETETVTFRVGLDGTLVYPGAIIKTNDPLRAGVRHGGRIKNAGPSYVVIDSAVTLTTGKTHTLYVMLPDGTSESRVLDLAQGVGSRTTLYPLAPFSQAPMIDGVWVLSVNDLEAETWRVVAVSELENAQFEITAITHNPSKYGFIDYNLTLDQPVVSSIRSTPKPPRNMTYAESLFESSPGIVSTRLTVSWEGETSNYVVTWRDPLGNLNTATSRSPSIDIDNLAPNTYTVSVVQVNALGNNSAAATIDVIVYGKTLPPADVTGFTIIKSSGLGIAQWDVPPDLDVRVGGVIVIRHSSLTTGATWNDGYILEVFSGGLVTGTLPLITGTYMAKALDSSGNYSEGIASFVATEGMVTGFTTVGTSTQATGFDGYKDRVIKVVGSPNVIQLDNAGQWDSQAGNVDSWSFLIDSMGTTQPEGVYHFTAAGGANSKYLDFDGTTNGWAQVAASAAINTGSISRFAWVRVDTVQTACLFHPGGTSTKGIRMFLAGTGGELEMDNAWGEIMNLQSPSNTIVAGEWAHIGCTYDATTDVARIYKNGVIVAETINSSLDSQLDTGCYLELGMAGGANPLNGAMDDYVQHNRALTQAEVLQLMDGFIPQSGLVVLLRFNDATTITDTGPNGLTITKGTGATLTSAAGLPTELYGAATLDLTTSATRRYEADITVQQFVQNDEIDLRENDIDTWGSFDGAIVDDCDVTLLASYTTGDPATNVEWSPWVPFFVADFTARAMRFRLLFESGDPTHNIKVSTLTVHAKVPA